MRDAKRQEGGKFGAGNNVGGRKGLPDELREHARSTLAEMLKPALVRLAGLIESPDEKVAIAAVKEALERNLGKSMQSLEVSSSDESPLSFVVRFDRKK